MAGKRKIACLGSHIGVAHKTYSGLPKPDNLGIGCMVEVPDYSFCCSRTSARRPKENVRS